MEWDRQTSRLFQSAVRVIVTNQRGVLAKVASEIADAGSNIDAISMEEDRAVFTTMLFLQRRGLYIKRVQHHCFVQWNGGELHHMEE